MHDFLGSTPWILKRMLYKHRRDGWRVVVSAGRSGVASAQDVGIALPRPVPVGGQARHDDGEEPSEDLRRTIADVLSGKIEAVDYPSAKEYLEDLYAGSDE